MSNRDARARIAWAMLTVVVLVVGGIVVGAATGNWVALAVVVAVFGVEAALLRWRARPHRGRRREWPVGDLAPGPESFTHLDHCASRAARFGPIFKTSFFDTPTCCVVDLDLGTALLREHADALGPPWGPIERFVPGGSIRGAASERNAELRRVFARTLTAGLVRSWEPAIALHVGTGFARAADDASNREGEGEGDVDPFPIVRAAALHAWFETFLGIAPDAVAFDEASALADELDPDRGNFVRPFSDAEIDAKLDRLAELTRQAATFRDCSRVPSTLAERFEAVYPGALDDDGLVRNLLYTTITTRDDIAGLFMWLLWYLVDDPSWAVTLRADPDGAPAIADRFVSETLRLQQSEFLMRRALEEIRFRDVVIPKGWLVRVCIREIHRDPRTIADAMTFDPDRFLHDDDRRVYAPFGVDRRFCLGEALSRTAARVFVLTFVDGFDATTCSDGPPEIGPQRHGAPSSRWRLVLRRRSRVSTT